jgi:hypothetical protein
MTRVFSRLKFAAGGLLEITAWFQRRVFICTRHFSWLSLDLLLVVENWCVKNV